MRYADQTKFVDAMRSWSQGTFLFDLYSAKVRLEALQSGEILE